MARLPVGIALGDPCGVGPEVTVKALAAFPRLAAASLVIGDPEIILRALRRARVAQNFPVLAIPDARLAALAPGRVSRLAGAMSARWLAEAGRLALARRIGAVVTAPVCKEAVALSRPGFRGQTEFLAALCRVAEPVMMLAGPTLRVVPVTRHLALRRVPGALSIGLILRALRITAHGLTRWFGIPRPRLAVCGLNPHAGEGGLMGHEDQRIVAPAVRRARRLGIRATGPLPADTVFAPARAGAYDAVVTMYHDQANIPIKMVEGARAVNMTLGLPFLRTSPAHGTAFDIAWSNRANAGSMTAAIASAMAAAGRA